MKKQVLFSVFFVVSIFFSTSVFAQYPISSYNTPVDHPGVFFSESSNLSSVSITPDMINSSNPIMSSEKRKLNVDVTDPEQSMTGKTVTIIAFSSDFRFFKGPYIINAGDEKIIEIDDKEWNVFVLGVSGGESLMSVYTTN